MSGLFDVAGKTALVTGGTRGIGFMIAKGLVESGVKVYISSRKADVGERAAAELSELGECISLPANLAEDAECERLAEELRERETRLHILVNNAGATWGAPLAEWTRAMWDRVLDLNVKGLFRVTQLTVPLLLEASADDDPARVINIGSVEGIKVPFFENYSYSASKAAVHMMTRHLASQLAPRITVNAIAPGPFESKMMAATLATMGKQIVEGCPMKRIGRPDDVAGAVIYLASRAGSYVTGSILPVDGGYSFV